MVDALLVIDMLNGFLEPGHNLYCGDQAREIIPNVKNLIKEKLKNGDKVFFVCDNHEPNDLEFKMFPVHCVKGSEETNIISELVGYAYPESIILKRRYSALFETDLKQKLEKLDPEKIILSGVCTDICVMHSASDFRNLDYEVEVPVDCVATFDQDAHAYALTHMEKILGVTLTNSTER